MTISDIKQALKVHYSAPLTVSFKQFRHGVIFFGVGLMMILMANAYMAPSIKQESIVMTGLCVLAYGFIVAMLAQMRMLISRLLQSRRKHRTSRTHI